MPQFPVVIPAYRPSSGLADLVQALRARAPMPIVIVDDGSGPGYEGVFAAVAKVDGVHLLRHAVNLGKGAALKTAFNFVLCTFPDLAGVVTADADGQHHPDDILRVASSLAAAPDSLVLGAREFAGNVPLRSRFGNVMTRGVVHALLGQKIKDTQTGLRGIPAALLPRVLRIEARGYEFELEMLLAAHALSMPIAEVPIRTIYEEGNKSSHFNPVIDSMKIYFVLLRFGSVSMMTALLDNLVFILAFHRTGNIILSQVVGRAVAVCFNYTMVRRSVFYSHQRHQSVLPKYLLLVLVSGSASYGGIELLNRRLGMPPVAAKLLVETLLFFVNFAVQRVFIFRPHNTNGGEREPEAIRALVLSALFPAAFAALLGVELYGFFNTRLFSQDIWSPLGLSRFARYLGVFLGLSIPLLAMVPWTFAGVITSLALALATIAAGPRAVLAVFFFLVSANALGSRLLRRAKPGPLPRDWCATLLGAGIYMFLMTFLARLPVNQPIVWGALLAIPIAADFRATAQRVRGWTTRIGKATLESGWERAAFALLAFVLIAHLLVTLKPEGGYDALAMHLAIPMDIAAHHVMTFQPSRFLWSVMPMGADWLYSIVFLFGGEYASRLLNFSMLLVASGLLFTMLRRWVSPAAAFLLVATFAATPVVQMVTGSLFVENVLAALVLGILAAIWQFGESGDVRYLFVTAALAGAAMTTKLGASAFVLAAIPFAIAEIVRHWNTLGRRRWLKCALSLLLLLVTALPTYVIAYAKTGNPIFPYRNERFHSPLLDPSADLTDVRFRIPVGPSALYTMTFHSSAAYEGQDGSFGFQYLLIAPLALLGLLAARRRAAAGAAIMAFGAAVLIMRSQPNVRYLYACMALLPVPFAALLEWMETHQRWMYRSLAAALVVCVGLDIFFLPSSSYYHKEFSLASPLNGPRKDPTGGFQAPVREVIDYFNRHHAGLPVLMTQDSTIAGLNAEIYMNHWHQYPTRARLAQVSTVPEMFQLLQQWNINYFIADKQIPGEKLEPPTLRALLADCTVPEYEFQDVYLARLDTECGEHGWISRIKIQPVLTVTPGFYDDFDPAIVFRGDWEHDDSFQGPDRHTITYTDTPGAEIAMSFEGKSVTYLFTRAFNRGIATITIDDETHDVDLYSPDTVWQSRAGYCCFGPGKHLVTITVTGRKNPKSAGTYVDLDSLTIE